MTRTTTDVAVTIVIRADPSAPGGIRLEITPTAHSVDGHRASCGETSAVVPVYGEMEPLRASPGAGAEVSLGGKSRGHLVALGVLAVVLPVAVVAAVGQRSGPAGTGSPAAVTTPPAIPDTVAPSPATPVVCRGDLPVSPEGCVPDPSKWAGPATGSAAPACLSLIESAARAMAAEPDKYALVVGDGASPGRTVDDAIRDQLSHARLFLTGQHPEGEPEDAEQAASLQAFDAAMAAADARPCS